MNSIRFFFLTLLLAACSSPSPVPLPDPVLPRTGNLAVVIEGLPQGVNGVVTVTGPGYNATVGQSVTLPAPVGLYSVTAEEVGDYLPNPPEQSVTVTEGATVEARVRYVSLDTAPAPPTELEAVSGDGWVRLSWQANPEPDLQAYRVYRTTLEPGEPVDIGSFDLLVEVLSSTVTHTDTALTPGTTYYYAVTAVNNAGLESAVQRVASAMPQAPDASGFTSIDWSTAAQAPLGVTESHGAVVDGELYVMGGYTSWNPLAVTTDIYIYDPAAGTLGSWRRAATSLPEPLTHAGVTVDGRDIYLAGGYVGLPPGRQTFASQNVWKLNVDTLSWEAMPPLPEARGAGGFVRLGRQLHYFGGSDLSRSDRVEHWNLSLDNPEEGWQTLPPLAAARNHFGAATLNGRIYAIGGQTGQDEAAVYHPDVFVYDPAQNSWSRAASLPSGRSHILESTLTMDGRILVLGGDIAPYVATNEVLAYDSAADNWTALTPLPRRLEAGIATEIGGTLYFTTGSGGFSRATYRGLPIP